MITFVLKDRIINLLNSKVKDILSGLKFENNKLVPKERQTLEMFISIILSSVQSAIGNALMKNSPARSVEKSLRYVLGT